VLRTGGAGPAWHPGPAATACGAWQPSWLKQPTKRTVSW
jgi:hypothetical protein